MYIYKTTNLVNGKFYIGKSQKTDNIDTYLGSGVVLQKAVCKYGKDVFIKEVLEHCNTIEELNEREVYWINKLNAINNGYNISTGGSGGDTITNNPNRDEIIEVQTLSRSEYYKSLTKEERCAIYGGDRKFLSELATNRMKDPVNRKAAGRSGKLHWAYGTTQSTELIQKRLQTRKQNGKGFRVTAGPWAPMAVRVTVDGNVIYYDSIADAANAFNISRDRVGYCMRQRKKNLPNYLKIRNKIVIFEYNEE